MVTIGLSRTVYEINGDSHRKSPIFPTSRVFCAPAEGVTLGIGYRRRDQKNLNDRATRWSIKFYDRFCRLDTIPACDRQTERQTDGQTRCRSKDRAMLCVARVKISIVSQLVESLHVCNHYLNYVVQMPR